MEILSDPFDFILENFQMISVGFLFVFISTLSLQFNNGGKIESVQYPAALAVAGRWRWTLRERSWMGFHCFLKME